MTRHPFLYSTPTIGVPYSSSAFPMSNLSSSVASSRCSIQIAKTKDEIEACYDIRMEGESISRARLALFYAQSRGPVFVVEQVSESSSLFTTASDTKSLEIPG